MGELPKVSNDFAKKVSKKNLSKNLPKYIIITLFIFAAVLFAQGDYGLLKIFRLNDRINNTQAEITRLKVKATDLKWEIDKLKTDSLYIKIYATEHYGYARPEGQVIQFVSSEDSLSK
jgi:cell division protein FtsB